MGLKGPYRGTAAADAQPNWGDRIERGVPNVLAHNSVAPDFPERSWRIELKPAGRASWWALSFVSGRGRNAGAWGSLSTSIR